MTMNDLIVPFSILNTFNSSHRVVVLSNVFRFLDLLRSPFSIVAPFRKISHFEFEQCLLDRRELMSVRLCDMASSPSNNNVSTPRTEDDYAKVFVFYSSIIQHIGEHDKVRQQVIAAAIAYLKRFDPQDIL